MKIKPFIGKRTLNIGCGTNRIDLKEAVNMDIDYSVLPDVVWDFNRHPFPFMENEFDVIVCSHALEHVRDLNSFMRECYRILKPGGTHFSVSPYYLHSSAFSNPEHVRFITQDTFMFFDRMTKNSDGRMFVEGMDFQLVKLEFIYADKRDAGTHPLDAFLKIGIIETISATMVAIKPMRTKKDFDEEWRKRLVAEAKTEVSKDADI